MSTAATAPGPELDRYGIPITHNQGAHQQQPRRCSMNEDEQRERRASIKAIMADTTLSPSERRRSIQGLMDGRRRSCGGSVSGDAPHRLSVGSAVSLCSETHDDAALAAAVDQHSELLKMRAAAAQFQNGDGGPLTPQQLAQSEAVALAMSTRMERNRPPCNHYERNCTMIAPCCGLAFGCRLCHDECEVLPPPLLTEQQKTEQAQKMRKYQRSASLPGNFSAVPDQEEHHTIDRHKVSEVICRNCFTRQSSKTNHCIKCNLKFGEYHCSICNLWMSAEENPYHCKDCGFCRVGGADNFRHCKDCGMCIDAALFDEHNCKIGKYMSNCPVCQEDLFSSRAASHEMPCGHAIHWHCFRELASYDSRCPICKKTAETPDRMASTWSAMAMGIALQPVPPDMAKVVDILCVDCEAQDQHRQWHFLGVQCRRCSSFNTVVEQILMAGPQAASFLREHGDGAPLPQEQQGQGGGVAQESGQGQGQSNPRHQRYQHRASIAPLTGGELLYDPYGLDSEDEEMEDSMVM